MRHGEHMLWLAGLVHSDDALRPYTRGLRGIRIRIRYIQALKLTSAACSLRGKGACPMCYTARGVAHRLHDQLLLERLYKGDLDYVCN